MEGETYHLTGFLWMAGAPGGGMRPHCSRCQAHPMPCLRLVLPQKQLLVYPCSVKEMEGQSST